MQKTTDALERMSLDELRTLARRLGISGYSNLRKAELVASIKSVDEAILRRQLFPTWYQTYHNHVYGAITVVGVILSILFYLWTAGESHRTVEKPIASVDYASLAPAEKEQMFGKRTGEPFVWEGFLTETLGFELGTLTGVPYDVPICIEIKPTQSSSPQLYAVCQFGELQPTDSGAELAIRLNWLAIGQHIRVSGMLDGTPERPILKEANLEAVFPRGE